MSFLKCGRGVAGLCGLFCLPVAVMAADLGENCCMNLEERVADLEVSAVRKGKRRVSVKLYGQVSRGILLWNNDSNVDGTAGNQQTGGDVYAVGMGNDSSRFGFKGEAKTGAGWSAGFKLEWETGDTLAESVAQSDDDGADAEGLKLRHEMLYLKHGSIGMFSMGQTSTVTDGIAEIDLSGAKIIANSGGKSWNGSFAAGTGSWGHYINNLDGSRRDVFLRYDSVTMAGFTVSAAFGEDDYWDVALRYANEFSGTVRIATGIGYGEVSGNDNGGVTTSTLVGSASAIYVPAGLFVAVAAGQSETEGQAFKQDYAYVKAGIRQKFNALGTTSLYGEYGHYEMRADSAATLWGVGIVQNLDAAAMKLYAGYRRTDLDDIAGNSFSAFLVGSSIRF